MSPLRAITLATLTVGVLDGLDAIIFFGLRGATPSVFHLEHEAWSGAQEVTDGRVAAPERLV